MMSADDPEGKIGLMCCVCGLQALFSDEDEDDWVDILPRAPQEEPPKNPTPGQLINHDFQTLLSSLGIKAPRSIWRWIGFAERFGQPLPGQESPPPVVEEVFAVITSDFLDGLKKGFLNRQSSLAVEGPRPPPPEQELCRTVEVKVQLNKGLRFPSHDLEDLINLYRLCSPKRKKFDVASCLNKVWCVDNMMVEDVLDWFAVWREKIRPAMVRFRRKGGRRFNFEGLDTTTATPVMDVLKEHPFFREVVMLINRVHKIMVGSYMNERQARTLFVFLGHNGQEQLGKGAADPDFYNIYLSTEDMKGKIGMLCCVCALRVLFSEEGHPGHRSQSIDPTHGALVAGITPVPRTAGKEEEMLHASFRRLLSMLGVAVSGAEWRWIKYAFDMSLPPSGSNPRQAGLCIRSSCRGPDGLFQPAFQHPLRRGIKEGVTRRGLGG